MQPSPFCIAFCIALAAHAGAAPVVPGFDRFAGEADAGVAAGLLLYNELQCAACHGPLGTAPSAFPPRTAPNLQGAGERIRFDYLQAFIAAPHAVKPGTTMPDLLAAERKSADAEALAHFLLSLGGPFQEDAEAPPEAELERGKHLFHTVGCVACHEPSHPPDTGHTDDPFADTSVVETPAIAFPSVPLPDLASKTSATALAAFLQNPEHTRPGGRMPNMTLTESEATAIASWLQTRIGVPPVQSRIAVPPVQSRIAVPTVHDPAKAERGRALFQSLGCANCHQLEGIPTDPAAPPLNAAANWSGGCLAESRTPVAPWFDLSPPQRTALAALKNAPEAAPTPADTINGTLLALNCYACHDRDGRGGPEPGRAAYFTETETLDLGDEGRLPPALTGVGAKLTPAWLHDILTDAGRIRPYMATRMPHFPPEHVTPLAEALLEVDRDPNPLPVNVSGLEHHHRNMYGRELMGVNGLGCVTCHDLDAHRSLGIPAVDLANVPQRLQPEWFMKYMLDPASLRPQTRMPDFFDGNKSLNSTLFKGDAVKQVEALWIYLKEVKKTRLPEGMEDDTDYELRPTDRPLIHRTFIEDVGTHAIAVGFPGGLNYAYDALGVRPAILWRGRFIDAESAWADRFVPFVEPLGEDVVALPVGAQLARSPEGPWDGAEIQYKGYRLNDKRAPVFRYALGDVEIEDAIRPADDGKKHFVRRLTFRGPPQTIYLRAGADGADLYKTGDLNLGISVTPGQNGVDRVIDPIPEGAEFVTSEYRQGQATVKMNPRRTEGPDDIGWIVPVEVTESGTTIEQVITW